jgi:hypothetical protein
MAQYRQRFTGVGFLFAVFTLMSAIPEAHAQSAGAPDAPPEAAAITGAPPASNDNLISAFIGLGYAYTSGGFGIGGRYQKVVAPKGVIKNGPIHDELGFEGGIDYYHYDFGVYGSDLTYNEIAIVFGGVWNFWLLEDKLALYPKLDIAYRVGSFSSSSGTPLNGYGGIWFQGTAGVVYRLSGLSLRAELGSGSLRVGAGFSFF